MAKPTTTKATPKTKKAKTTTPVKDKSVKTESVEVTTINTKEAKEAPKAPRVSGTHRVKFKGNGSNARLGYGVSNPSASNAQLFVDNGWGVIVNE